MDPELTPEQKKAIAANVAKLRTQKRSDDEIAAYLRDVEKVDPATFGVGGARGPRAVAPTFAPADQVARAAPGSAPRTNAATALLSGAGQGATLGFADEILGGLDAANASLPKALGGESAPLREFPSRYVKSRDRIRTETKAMADEHPVANVTGELAGGVLSGGLIDRALVAAGMKALPAAATLGQKVAHGVKAGATIGGAAGLGVGEGDVGDQVKSTLGGAAAGATFGGLLPLAAGALKGGANLVGAPAVKDAVSSVGDRLRGVPVADRTRSRALDMASRALEQSGKTTADVRAMAATGKPVALVDAGENTRALARVARSAPGKAKQVIPDALEGRVEGQTKRIGADLESTLNTQPADVFQTADELAAAREAQATPLYDKAFTHGVVDDPRVAALLKIPDFQKGWKSVEHLNAVEGRSLPQIVQTRKVPTDLSKYTQQLEAQGVDPAEFARRVRAGQIPEIPPYTEVTEPHELPTVEALHHLKLAIDRQITDLTGSPYSDKRALGRALLKRQKELIDVLDQATGGEAGDYATARKQFAGQSRVMDALENGRKFIGDDSRVVARDLADASDAEREMYKVGAVDALRQIMRSTDDGNDVVRKLFAQEEKRDRIKALFDQPGEFDRLRESLGIEKNMVESRNKVLGGSQTAFTEAEKDAANPTLGSAAINFATGQSRRALGQVARMAIKRGTSGINEPVANHLAEILTAGAKNPADLNAILDALDERALRRLHKATKTRLLSKGGLTRGASAAAALSAETPSAPMAPE